VSAERPTDEVRLLPAEVRLGLAEAQLRFAEVRLRFAEVRLRFAEIRLGVGLEALGVLAARATDIERRLIAVEDCRSETHHQL